MKDDDEGECPEEVGLKEFEDWRSDPDQPSAD